MVMCMLYCLEQDWEQVKIATRAQSLDQYEVAKSHKMTCTSLERAASEAFGLTGPGVPAVFSGKSMQTLPFSVDLFLSTDLEGLFLIQGKVVQFLEHSHN